MGKIIKYKDLTIDEIKTVNEFLETENKFETMEEMENHFNSEIYDCGNGVLFYFRENEVIASICIVLELAKDLGNSFICNASINKESNDLDKVIKSLVNESISISKRYGASDIRLGISQDLLHIFEDAGFIHEYKSLEMQLDDKNTKYEILSLKEVNSKNIETYLEIYKDSFSDMPHGTMTKKDKVEELLNKNDYFCYIVCDEDKEIGFMDVSIEDNKGMFDIGLCKKYRGKNYGHRLLETAIESLLKRNATVNLIVIEDNQVAYNMYKKRGFQETRIINYWMKLEA